MIFYESTSSSIIGKPQIERVNQLQMNQVYTPLDDHVVFTIKGVVSGSEEPSDSTFPTEAYVKTYVENNITSLQNQDLSDTTSFLQIISAPLNGCNYHNFITKSDVKTLNLDFSTTSLKFLNKGEVYTCSDNLTYVVPDASFSGELFARFDYNTGSVSNFNKYSTMFSSVLASQAGWVSSSSSGSSPLTGDYCVAFPSNRNSEIEYTFVSYSNNLMKFNDQFFDTPRGQFINLSTGTRTSCKLIPTGNCTAYRLTYLFITKDINNVWTVASTRIKPTIFNKSSTLTIVENAWYFDNMKQCWYTGSGGGLKECTACFVGILACNSNDVIAAWNMPPAHLLNPYNTIRLDQIDGTSINTVSEQNTINIFNKKINVVSDIIKPNLNLLSKCCQYYLFVDLNGNFQIDWMHPYENAYGEYYHPINYWKCVGEFFITQNLLIDNVLDLRESVRYDDNGQLKTLTYEIPQAFTFTNPYGEYVDLTIYPCCRHFFAPLNKRFSKNLSYYTLTFASAGGNGFRTDIDNTATYASITSSYNELIAYLEDGKRGDEATAGTNNYGRSGGTKYCANTAISSSGARSTATSLFDTNKYAKGGNSYTGFGGNSGNVCLDQIAVARLPECFINFGTTPAYTNNSLGLAKFELTYYKDN